MGKILPIVGLATALTVTPLLSKGQTTEKDNIKQKNQTELVDNFNEENNKINEKIINLVDYQKQTLIYLNKLRKTNNLPPLKYDKDLEKLAIEQSKYLKIKKGNNNILTRKDHINGSNQYPIDRVKEIRGERIDDIGTENRATENIVTLNLNSIKKVIDLRMGSKKGHKEALLGPYSHIGVGYEKGSNFFIIVFARENPEYKK